MASLTWAHRFKVKHNIRQRKVTKFISKTDAATLEESLQAPTTFQEQTCALITKYPNKDFVINTDQTGCEYQTTFNRSLDYKGVKTVLVKKQNLAKLTHCYTAQYSLTASGKLLPKVFLCMQEPGDTLGPRVIKTVELLTEEYKNIVVTCSKSGKLTKEIYKHFLHTTIKPYVTNNNFLLIIDSCGGQVGTTIYDEMFHKEGEEVTYSIKVIPPKCTPFCQPCDVYFYRQVKNIIKRLQNASDLLKEQREVASREDALKIHSLVHYLLSPPAFYNMIKYAWVKSKLTPLNEKLAFQNVNDICFPPTLFKKKCYNCQNTSFICSWCQSVLCFKCFCDKYHPKVCSRSLTVSNTE